MDYFDRDMQRVMKRMRDKLNLGNISRGNDLPLLEELAATFNFCIVLHHPGSVDAFFASKRFFNLLGKKKGASEYVYADYNEAFKQSSNMAYHALFLQHFSTPAADNHRGSYKFKDVKTRVFWLNSCSCLMDTGTGYQPIILTLLYQAQHTMSTDHQILNDLIRGLNVDELMSKINKLSDRELEVFEYLAQGTDKKTASDELFISEDTFITHRKNLRKKIGSPYNKKLSIIYLANKHYRNLHNL